MIVEIGDKRVTTLAQLRSDRRLRAYRRHRVEDLWMLPEAHPKRVAQQDDFDAADAIYESDKMALEAALEILSSDEWAAYCDAVGWEPDGETQAEQVADYAVRG